MMKRELMKREIIPLVLLCFVAMIVLIAPVAGGLMVTDGATIVSPYGATSPVITSDSEIQSGETITIDIWSLNYYWVVDSGSLTNDNIIISDDSVAANWTGVVEGDTLTLTSTDGITLPNENITVTFTGARGNHWIQDSSIFGDPPAVFPLTVTRTENGDSADISFTINTILPPAGGLTIHDGDWITSPSGATSPVITIANTGIPEDGTILIEVQSS